MGPNETAGSPRRLVCIKCKTQEATLTQRSEAVCKNCFLKYTAHKCMKQIGLLGRALDAISSRKYLVGLSFGVSSSVLVDLLNDHIETALARGRKAPFDVVVVHIDVGASLTEDPPADAVMQRYREKYPRFEFRCIPLATVLDLHTIDWSVFPARDRRKTPAEQMGAIFDPLPSATSRVDILRLFVRHILVSAAAQSSCHAVLLGYSTTALAELTLAETAKGRGFSLPWQINDGPVAMVDFPPPGQEDNGSDVVATTGPAGRILMQHPLRDLLRKELITYSTLTSPPLTELIPHSPAKAPPIVSHKDVSIEEIMARYFEDIEENYPSIVANVAKTTGKLSRLEADEKCGICGMSLDEQGDERWRGEIGDPGGGERAASKGKLCYGCERSIYG